MTSFDWYRSILVALVSFACIFSGFSISSISNASTSTTGRAVFKESRCPPSPAKRHVRYVQRVLGELGYAAGPTDGLFGPQTNGAIDQFKDDFGVPANAENVTEILAELAIVMASEASDGADPGSRQYLHDAAARGDWVAVQRSLYEGADIDSADRDGWTAMHYATVQGRREVLCDLIRAGATIDIPDSNGYTPMLMAASEGKNEIIRTLIAHGADVHAVTNEGGTARLIADGSTSRLLAKAGALSITQISEMISMLSYLGFTVGEFDSPDNILAPATRRALASAVVSGTGDGDRARPTLTAYTTLRSKVIEEIENAKKTALTSTGILSRYHGLFQPGTIVTADENPAGNRRHTPCTQTGLSALTHQLGGMAIIWSRGNDIVVHFRGRRRESRSVDNLGDRRMTSGTYESYRVTYENGETDILLFNKNQRSANAALLLAVNKERFAAGTDDKTYQLVECTDLSPNQPGVDPNDLSTLRRDNFRLAFSIN